MGMEARRNDCDDESLGDAHQEAMTGRFVEALSGLIADARLSERKTFLAQGLRL
jgi:hypothetical protein